MNALVWFDTSISVRLALMLWHSLWLGCAIAAVNVVADVLLRNASANTKYALHVATLLIILLCLPITFATTDVPRTRQDTASISGLASPPAMSSLVKTPRSPDHSVALANTNAEASSLTLSTHEEVASSAADIVPVSTDNARRFQSLWTVATSIIDSVSNELSPTRIVRYASYLSAIYILGVLFRTLRLLAALHGGRRLRRTAEPVTDPTLLSTIQRQAHLIGLKIAPAVAYCGEISVPVVTGIVSPMILLPATLASGLSPQQLEALLAHELAHLWRLDPLVNLLQRMIEAVLFFHPAVWYVSRRIDAERENACDDLVLGTGVPRLQYADALVRMAELSVSLRQGRLADATAMVAASGTSSTEFKRRVLRLVGGETPHLRLSGWGIISMLLLLLMVGTLPLAILPIWAAQSPGDQHAAGAAGERPRRIGQKIEDFQLRDYLGAEHQLRDFANSRLVVIAFLGVDCPLAKLYGPRLAELAEKYKSQRVAFVGINSNLQDTPTDIGHYVRQHGIKFPLLKDPANRIADQFGAERTPEVFLLDEQRVVRYWGLVDDQYGVGYTRAAATQNFLSAAIDELLNEKPVSDPEVTSVGCHIGRVTRKPPRGEITYSNQISRILQRRCVECHRDGGIAPFAMDSYAEVAGWAETIREVVADQRMPPWHANPKFGQFSNDHRMPEAEKQLLYRWVENGVIEGNPAELPPTPELVDGWSLGHPDLVVSMPSSFTVAADGIVPYQYFTVDPGFTEGKWVRASEVLPGTRSVVHHVVVFINPPGGDPILEEKGVGFEMVGSYVPGTPPMQLEAGVARFVPAGSTFVFQVHYTPDGKERTDQTKIGLYFADPTTIHHTVQTTVAVNLDFTIPPNATSHRVEASLRFDHDTEVYALTPHMHFRGKSFRFEVTYPNGSREVLLDVPRYDFNWQNTYRLARPKLLPEGTLLQCFAEFDNSANNRSNPDPSIPVKWGEQTWEEMMIGYVECVFLNQDLSQPEPQVTPLGNDEYLVRFRYRPDRPIRSVNVAGTFNEWNTSSRPLQDPDHDGVFTADLRLKKGPYRYKFVIDGNYWTHDPASRILTGIFHESFFVAGADSKLQPVRQP